MVSFTIFTASVRKIVDTTLYMYHNTRFTQCKVYTKHVNVVCEYSVGFCTFKALGAYQFPLWYNPLEPFCQYMYRQVYH